MAICNGEMAKADIRGVYARDGYKTEPVRNSVCEA